MRSEHEEAEDIAALLVRERLKACIKAGANEPDRSFCRSSWKSVGFYLQTPERELVTTWRR